MATQVTTACPECRYIRYFCKCEKAQVDDREDQETTEPGEQNGNPD